ERSWLFLDRQPELPIRQFFDRMGEPGRFQMGIERHELPVMGHDELVLRSQFRQLGEYPDHRLRRLQLTNAKRVCGPHVLSPGIYVRWKQIFQSSFSSFSVQCWNPCPPRTAY